MSDSKETGPVGAADAPPPGWASKKSYPTLGEALSNPVLSMLIPVVVSLVLTLVGYSIKVSIDSVDRNVKQIETIIERQGMQATKMAENLATQARQLAEVQANTDRLLEWERRTRAWERAMDRFKATHPELFQDEGSK